MRTFLTGSAACADDKFVTQVVKNLMAQNRHLVLLDSSGNLSNPVDQLAIALAEREMYPTVTVAGWNYREYIDTIWQYHELNPMLAYALDVRKAMYRHNFVVENILEAGDTLTLIDSNNDPVISALFQYACAKDFQVLRLNCGRG